MNEKESIYSNIFCMIENLPMEKLWEKYFNKTVDKGKIINNYDLRGNYQVTFGICSNVNHRFSKETLTSKPQYHKNTFDVISVFYSLTTIS